MKFRARFHSRARSLPIMDIAPPITQSTGLHIEGNWLFLPGRSLAEIEAAALRAAFVRFKGNRAAIGRAMGLSRFSVLRKLARLGLRQPRRVLHLREQDIARAFERLRQAIVTELKIHDSTLARWLNKQGPFAVEEK